MNYDECSFTVTVNSKHSAVVLQSDARTHILKGNVNSIAKKVESNSNLVFIIFRHLAIFSYYLQNNDVVN